jgi:S-adenosylhomocysteine hydrolase
MPLLTALHQRFAKDRPFDGLAVAACLHITAETAMLVRLLQAGGAAVALAASNPLSTQDDIAAALAVNHGIAVFARPGSTARATTATSRRPCTILGTTPHRTWSSTTAATWSTRCTPRPRPCFRTSRAAASPPPRA